MKFEEITRRHFLAAGAAGAERFFERQAKAGYRPLQPGDVIEDKFRLKLKLE